MQHISVCSFIELFPAFPATGDHIKQQYVEFKDKGIASHDQLSMFDGN